MEGFIRGGHRKEVQRSKPESMPRMDSGAKEPRASASGPDVGASLFGYFWLGRHSGRLSKVTRRKGGTLGRRYRSNGYVPNQTFGGLLLSVFASAHAEQPLGCVEVTVGGYKTPNYDCLSQQMGNTFGTSVKPQRPPN